MIISKCFKLTSVGDKTEIKSEKGYGLLAMCRGALGEEQARIRKNKDGSYSYLSGYAIPVLDYLHF